MFPTGANKCIVTPTTLNKYADLGVYFSRRLLGDTLNSWVWRHSTVTQEQTLSPSVLYTVMCTEQFRWRCEVSQGKSRPLYPESTIGSAFPHSIVRTDLHGVRAHQLWESVSPHRVGPCKKLKAKLPSEELTTACSWIFNAHNPLRRAGTEVPQMSAPSQLQA